MADEFDIIKRYFGPLTRGNEAALGLTDDAAALPMRNGFDQIVTTDAVVQGVHFLDDEAPENVAHRLCASNLSDLAAMGARPVGFTLAAAWRKNTDASYIAAFAGALSEWVDEFDFPLLGGDTVTTPGPMMFSLTAIGEVEAGLALRRSGASPGDTVCVSGCIGDGALGLLVAQGKLGALSTQHQDYLLSRFRRPSPRISAGRALVGIASACLDVSDGLVQDLGHIAETSKVGIHIDAARVPLSDAARAALEIDPSLIETILTGGDDYELAFTAAAAPTGDGKTPLSAIGEAAEGDGVGVTGADGKPLNLCAGGFNHFSGT